MERFRVVKSVNKYTFYSDPGHAWLEVERKELVRLNITSSISGCSYQRGKYVYLEEDCDAGIFIRAKKAIGEAVEFRERYDENTPIRDYDHFVKH